MATTNLSTLTDILNKWLNRLAPLLLLIATILLCWNIARIVWLFVAPPTSPNLSPVARQTNISVQENSPSTFTIFSQPVATPSVQPISAPTNIFVKGVMTAQPVKNSSALIKVNGTVKNYRLGKQLEGTPYTLVDVEWNQITLADDMQNESIIKINEPMELNQDFIAKGNSDQTGSISMIDNFDTAENNSQFNSEFAEIPDENTSSEVTDNATNAINNAVSQLKEDPSGYLSRMGVHASNEGYEVTGAMPEMIRNRIGLQSGDKVISINGQNVGNNPSADSDLLKKIQESGQAQIKVQRGKQVITIRQKF